MNGCNRVLVCPDESRILESSQISFYVPTYTHTCTACTPLRICIYIYTYNILYTIYIRDIHVFENSCIWYLYVCVYIYTLYCVYTCLYMYIYPKTCNPMLISFQRIPLSPPHKRELELRHHPDSAGRHG